jgi:hypothetical protein
LRSGATGSLLGTTLQALLAAAQLGVRCTTSTLGCAAGELQRTAVLGLICTGCDPGQQRTQSKERTGKQFRKHEHILQ